MAQGDPTPGQLLAVQAHIALIASDYTLFRCIEAGVAFPQTWKDYRNVLRAIVTTQTGVVPAHPTYPV